MTHDDKNQELPPIQPLLAACPATHQENARYAWLHGFCLLTLRPGPGMVQLDGEVRIGHRHADNADLIDYLAEALDPAAVLAGYDLQDMISRLGRLPIDAAQPAPAVALLNKLRAMVDGHPGLDVGRDDDTRIEVHNHAVTNGLEVSGDFNEIDEDVQVVGGVQIRSGFDNGSPRRLAAELADTAGACLLAVGDFYLPKELQPQLLAAWQRWRAQYRPVFPPASTYEVAQDA